MIKGATYQDAVRRFRRKCEICQKHERLCPACAGVY